MEKPAKYSGQYWVPKPKELQWRFHSSRGDPLYCLCITIVSLPLTTFLAIQKNMDSWELLTKISVSMPTTTDYFYFDFF